MSMLNMCRRRGSAPVARERLQVLLAHERSVLGRSDLLVLLREVIIEAIARHVTLERDQVQVRMNKGGAVSTLKIDVEIPGKELQATG